MNPIIVAIDFSKTSLHALKYAIYLANRMKSRVIMVWVDNLLSGDSIFTESAYDAREEARRNLEEIAENSKELLKEGELTFKQRKGKVYYEIAQLARQVEATLIVTGTHGVSGFDEYMIGSNAYRIVTNSPCPVITIRPQFDFSHGIHNIVLPIDETRNSCQKVPFTALMATIFGATVHIFSLYSTPLKALNQKVDHSVDEIIKQFTQAKISFTQDARIAENVSLSTLEYAERVRAELISIVTDQETSLTNVLLGQYAQHMVNNSPVPVLTINPNEIMKSK
ncbi:MAG: universal stress protein [Bacteroidales bacterium]|nr:universal stress protein [Lentimicrobiaceae bacterium]MDD5694104.1 universal stress protein [Bacteroidales bacterium]